MIVFDHVSETLSRVACDTVSSTVIATEASNTASKAYLASQQWAQLLALQCRLPLQTKSLPKASGRVLGRRGLRNTGTSERPSYIRWHTHTQRSPPHSLGVPVECDEPAECANRP